jgi:hypothetical protein
MTSKRGKVPIPGVMGHRASASRCIETSPSPKLQFGVVKEAASWRRSMRASVLPLADEQLQLIPFLAPEHDALLPIANRYRERNQLAMTFSTAPICAISELAFCKGKRPTIVTTLEVIRQRLTHSARTTSRRDQIDAHGCVGRCSGG